MRNPAKSVRRLTQLANAEKKLAALWNEFEESHPKSLELARNYGKPDTVFHDEILEEWRKAIVDNLVKVEEKRHPQELGVPFTFASKILGTADLERRGSGRTCACRTSCGVGLRLVWS